MLKRFLSAFLFVCLAVGFTGCAEEQFLDLLANPEPVEVTDLPEEIATLLFDYLGTRQELVDRFESIEPNTEQWEFLFNWNVRAISEMDLKRIYYSRYIDAGGVSIVGHLSVDDRFFMEARSIVLRMTAKHPEIREQMTPEFRFYKVIMVEDASIRELPERLWRRNSQNFVGACNPLLCYSTIHDWTNRYMSTFVHEFAHAIHRVAINGRGRNSHLKEPLDPTFDDRLRVAYDAAMAAGKWQGLYASTNYGEYWAEGVRFWYYLIGGASLKNPANEVIAEFSTHADFQAYDPLLFELIDEWFPRDSFIEEF